MSNREAEQIRAQGDALRAQGEALAAMIRAANSQPIVQNSGNISGNQNLNPGSNNVIPANDTKRYTPTYIVTSADSYSPELSWEQVSSKSQEANNTSNKRKWLIPLITALSIIGAIALAALGIGIYVLITLSKESTTTTAITTETTTVAMTNGIISITLNWNTSGNTIAGTTAVSGISANHLNRPFGLALDSSNTLYISDSTNNRIQKQALNAWASTTVAGLTNGISGSGSDELFGPSGIVVDTTGNIYVADTRNHRIQFWYSGTSFGLTIIGNSSVAGSSNNQMNTPYGITCDAQTGIIYVADTSNHRVISFSPGSSTGSVVAGGNGQGLSSNQLNTPTVLYFDSSTNSLVIANTNAHNIVRWILGDTSWSLVAGSSSGISGASSTLLNMPYGVTLDSMGNVYVADTRNHRIQFFSSGQSSGTTIAGVSGTNGSSSTLLSEPVSIILDSQFNLYVADRNNHRIQKFIRI